jgi:hypothetical protein
MVFCSNDYDSSLWSSDEQMYQKMHMQHQIVYVTRVVGINTLELFNAMSWSQMLNNWSIELWVFVTSSTQCEQF